MRARITRAWLGLGIGVVLWVALPSAAQAGAYNGQCAKLTRQISHFQDVSDMARDRDDELWLASTAAHIERLRDRRSRLCPEYDQLVARMRSQEFWRETYALTLAGAKAAMRYFTFGMY